MMGDDIHNIEYKTKKIGLWIAIITLVGIIIGIFTELIPLIPQPPIEKTERSNAPPKDSSTEIIQKKTKEIVVDVNSVKSNSTPSLSVEYDTVHLLLDARLDKASIEINNQPARIISREGIHTYLVVKSKENYLFKLKNGERICEVSKYIDGNQTITINLTDCK